MPARCLSDESRIFVLHGRISFVDTRVYISKSDFGYHRYLLLDVESGAVHLLDEAAFLVARALELGEDPLTSLSSKEEAQEILEEFEELRRAGMFDSPELNPPENRDETQVIKSMCLHVAHDCNLRCKYCFASTGEFHGERMLMTAESAAQRSTF